MPSASLYNGVVWVSLDVALVDVVSHLDVSMVSPSTAPGVLHNPVGFASGPVISDSEDGVVDGGLAAVGVIVHTAVVVLERLRAGVDEDSVRAGSVNGVSHSGGAHGRSIPVGGDLGLGISIAVILAPSILSSVVVVRLHHLSSLSNDGLVSSGGPSSITGTISAVNKLLFGKIKEGTSGLRPGSLNSSCDSECPATSTSLLILDMGDHVVVPVVMGIGGAGEDDGLLLAPLWDLSSEDGVPFFLGPVSSLIDGGVEGVESLLVLGVVFVDESEGFSKHTLPKLLFFVAPVDLVVGLLEVRPFIGGSRSGHSDQGKDDKHLHFSG